MEDVEHEELTLIPKHRPTAEIAVDLANADAELSKIKAKAKQVHDGYKAQIDECDERVERLRDEYAQARIAVTGTI